MFCPGCGVQIDQEHKEGCQLSCRGCAHAASGHSFSSGEVACRDCFRVTLFPAHRDKWVTLQQRMATLQDAASPAAMGEGNGQDATAALSAIGLARTAIGKLPNSRERSLALTKLDECELWLARALEPQRDFVNA